MESLVLNGKTYQVLRLLGKGKGGYSYLVTDGDRKYTLKQIHHEPCDYYQFGDKLASELRDYETLSRIGVPMPKLLAVDREGERLLKEYIDGDTVYTQVKEDRLDPMVRELLEKICQRVYAAGINIDYFPTNFIFSQGTLYYIDYECNGYMEQWDFEHWGWKYWEKTPEFLQYAAEH